MNSIYIISEVLYLSVEDGTATKTFMRVVVGAKDVDAAYQKFIAEFEESKEVAAGWQLAGNPTAIEVDKELYDSWGSAFADEDTVVPFAPRVVDGQAGE